MKSQLHARVVGLGTSPANITARQRQIHDEMLACSSHLQAGNFVSISTADIERLFDLYDQLFFGGLVRSTVGRTPLRFRLSERMTKAGGKTTRYFDRRSGQTKYFEIAVSTTLLFQCFSDDDHRPIVVGGLQCRDRLDALQRTMEHELVHLIEMLIWTDSSCAAQRFQAIANKFFAHTEHTHRLITQVERAHAKFGVRTGDQVRFRFEGATHVGIVNRITKRATILVEDQNGAPYSDGKRYLKFYVPLQMLETVS